MRCSNRRRRWPNRVKALAKRRKLVLKKENKKEEARVSELSDNSRVG